MDKNTNALNWFEIAATDIDRAKKFYENIFDIDIEVDEMMGMKMGGFPYEPGSGKAAGAIVQGPMHKPSMDGAVVYFNSNPNMDPIVAKIEGAGGKIIMPKTKINDEIGYMAFFVDSEGNRVALHSQN